MFLSSMIILEQVAYLLVCRIIDININIDFSTNAIAHEVII